MVATSKVRGWAAVGVGAAAGWASAPGATRATRAAARTRPFMVRRCGWRLRFIEKHLLRVLPYRRSWPAFARIYFGRRVAQPQYHFGYPIHRGVIAMGGVN